jgi:hypothetical protein
MRAINLPKAGRQKEAKYPATHPGQKIELDRAAARGA